LLRERDSTASRIDVAGIYLFQKEFAVIGRDRPSVIGSDRATTCHILFVSSSSHVFCAHLDGSQGQTAALIAALRESYAGEEALDVHLAGGFADERGLSVSLGAELLAALDRGWPGVRLNLKTACIGPLNTIRAPRPAPVIRALAFDDRTSDLIPNVSFSDCGPNVEWRAARAAFGNKALVRATDRTTGHYWLDPTDTIAIPHRQYLLELLRCDDQTLLQLTSTSPDAEDADFCERMRETVRFLLSLLA
jgi:hypothetical protein